jgi:hypothetical protein
MPEIEIDLSKPLRDTTHPKYLPSPGGRGFTLLDRTFIE